MELTNFEFPELNDVLPAIRLDDDSWYFSAKETCVFADLSSTTTAARWVRTNVPSKWIREIKTPGDGRPGLYLSKAGFYWAVSQGKSETALKFRDLVFEVILPTIDSTGYYIAPKITDEQLEKLESQIKELKKEVKSLESTNKSLDKQLDYYVIGRKLSADEEVNQYRLRMKYLESVSPPEYREHAIHYARFVSELESPGFLYRKFADKLTEKQYKEYMRKYVKEFRHIILKNGNHKRLLDMFRSQYPKVL